MSRRTTAGFTLMEALSTLLVFGFFVIVLFMTITWGFRSFSLAVAKSDVTTEARRLSLFIERELRSSTYFSVTAVRRETLRSERRDALCFVSRDDWSTGNAFDPSKGTPAWNRYFVYYATKNPAQNFGQFVRMCIRPLTPGDIGSFPYPPFSAAGTQENYLPDNPEDAARLSDVESARVIASTVQEFETRKIPTSQEVELRLLLRQNGMMARRANGDREGGTFELQYRVQPQNTL